jgi:FkbM family methyltransferase
MSSVYRIKQYVPRPLWDGCRRLWIALRHASSFFTPYVRTRTYNGLTLYYSRGNTIIERLRDEPVFEEVMSKKIVEDLRASATPVFMDVGANLGLIIANVLHAVPDTHIIAFEPGPKQLALLTKTITANKLEEQVSLEQVALSDTNGTHTFYTHVSRDYAKDGLHDTGRGEKTVPIEVTTCTLDSWWQAQGRPQVAVVKIDTEGAELLILRGAKTFMQTVHPVLYLEIEQSNLQAYPYTAFDLFDFLTALGYAIETLAGNRVERTTLESYMAEEDTFRAVFI